MAQLAQHLPVAGASPGRGTWVSTALWWVMLLLSAVIAVYGSTYFLITPRDEHFARYIFPLRLHIAGGIGRCWRGRGNFHSGCVHGL